MRARGGWQLQSGMIELLNLAPAVRIHGSSVLFIPLPSQQKGVQPRTACWKRPHGRPPGHHLWWPRVRKWASTAEDCAHAAFSQLRNNAPRGGIPTRPQRRGGRKLASTNAAGTNKLFLLHIGFSPERDFHSIPMLTCISPNGVKNRTPVLQFFLQFFRVGATLQN